MSPSTMRAVAIERPGGPDVLQVVERPRPVPGAGEVLIRVQAAGVNRPDVLQRKGAYAPPPGVSDLPGLEVAGTVEGGDLDGSGWTRGDRVCALVAGGGYARVVRCSRRTVPSGPARPVVCRGGGAARNVLHGLEQCVRSGAAGSRRVVAGPGRHQRHRRGGDPAGCGPRSRGLRDGGVGRQGAGLRSTRRASRHQLPHRRLRGGREGARRRDAASTSSSTWWPATMCRAKWAASPTTAGW